MKIFLLDNLDTWYNLAFENWLFHRKDLAEEDLLILWRNQPSVIIGRFQNPWLECRLKEMNKRNISFARRESGGGAVYHDIGNTNFSFITGDSESVRENCTSIIVQSLILLGIKAKSGERNDIYVGERKVSGSASKYSSGRVLHHGTLLIDADLDSLNYFLTAKDYKSGKLKSQGTESVTSQVTNLIEVSPSVNHEQICQAVIEKSGDFFGHGSSVFRVSRSDMENIAEVCEYRSRIMSWEWLYGSTPGFSVSSNADIGGIDTLCSFTVKKGIIKDVRTEYEWRTEEMKNAFLSRYIGKRCDLVV